MQISAKNLAQSLSSPWEKLAALLAIALAVGVSLLEAYRPHFLSDAIQIFLTSCSLLLSISLLLARAKSVFILITFLPALPLAFLSLGLKGTAASTGLVPAITLAFLGRCLVLWFSGAQGAQRARLAKELKQLFSLIMTSKAKWNYHAFSRATYFGLVLVLA
jgi:ABC-type transport system involved in cytochrome bd biosynthesis fused ATPase/permease subunit